MPIFRKVVHASEIINLGSAAEVKAHLAYRTAELLGEAGAPSWAPVMRDNSLDTDAITLAVKWPEEEAV